MAEQSVFVENRVDQDPPEMGPELNIQKTDEDKSASGYLSTVLDGIFVDLSISLEQLQFDYFLELLEPDSDTPGSSFMAFEMIDACRRIGDVFPSITEEKPGSHPAISAAKWQCTLINDHGTSAHELLLQAAESGASEAILKLPSNPPPEAFSGPPDERTIVLRDWQYDSISRLLDIADQGVPLAYFEAAKLIANGIGDIRDEKLAIQMFGRFLESNNGTVMQRAFAEQRIEQLREQLDP